MEILNEYRLFFFNIMILIVIIILVVIAFISNKHERQTMSIKGGGDIPDRYTEIKNVKSLSLYNNDDNTKYVYMFTYSENDENGLTADDVFKKYISNSDTSFITNQNTSIPVEKGRIIIRNNEKPISDKSPMFRSLFNKLTEDERNIIKGSDSSPIDTNIIDTMTILTGNYGKYVIYKDEKNIQKMKDILDKVKFTKQEFSKIPTDKL